jgi:hypothetical protein
VADDTRRRVCRLTLGDLTFERALAFLRHLEEIRRNQVRTRNQRLAAFVLTAGDLTGAEMGEALVKVLPRMRRMVAKHVRPFIATVSRSGDVTLELGGERKGGVTRDG